MLAGARKGLTRGREQVVRKFGFDQFSRDFVAGVAEVVQGRKGE